MPWGPDDWDAWSESRSDRRRRAVPNDEPLAQLLRDVPNRERLTIADLGCGRGGWLPFLAAHFAHVYAVDYAPASLAAARRSCAGLDVTFRRRDLRDLTPLRGRLHVALAVDSIVGPRPSDVVRILEEVHGCLVEGGLLVATFPASPREGGPVPLVLGDEGGMPGPVRFGETEAQYRLRRVGFRGLRIRRLGKREGPQRLLCVATRRANN